MKIKNPKKTKRFFQPTIILFIVFTVIGLYIFFTRGFEALQPTSMLVVAIVGFLVGVLYSIKEKH